MMASWFTWCGRLVIASWQKAGHAPKETQSHVCVRSALAHTGVLLDWEDSCLLFLNPGLTATRLTTGASLTLNPLSMSHLLFRQTLPARTGACVLGSCQLLPDRHAKDSTVAERPSAFVTCCRGGRTRQRLCVQCRPLERSCLRSWAGTWHVKTGTPRTCSPCSRCCR